MTCQGWEVKSGSAPFRASLAGVVISHTCRNERKLFACHGDPQMADFRRLVPQPPLPSAANTPQASDSLFLRYPRGGRLNLVPGPGTYRQVPHGHPVVQASSTINGEDRDQ